MCVVAIQRTAVEGCTSVESLSVLVAMVEGGVGIWSKRIGFGWWVEKWVWLQIFINSLHVIAFSIKNLDGVNVWS